MTTTPPSSTTTTERPLRARFVALDDTVTPVAGVVIYEAKDPGRAVDDAIKAGTVAPYGAVLWDSATDVARALYATDMRGRRVLELGCGCGLVGVVCAVRGARVLCTDVDEHTLTATARAAADANVVVDVDHFDLVGGDPLPFIDGEAPTDVILADVLYEPLLAAAAARRAQQALALGARVIVGDPDRAGRRDFIKLMREANVAAAIFDGDVVFSRSLDGVADGAATICVLLPRGRD